MLDIYSYRASESLAKQNIPSWRLSQTHTVDHFERIGFPVRVATPQELVQLLDTMQENRFDAYMDEIGGLDENDLDLVIKACRDFVNFQLIYFPNSRPIVPLSTIMSTFALYDKLRNAVPNFRSVLEVGAGCGYLSFMLKYHKSLEDYSQTEACESFYLLQNFVNCHVFGAGFREHAFLPSGAAAQNTFSSPRPDLEVSPAAPWPMPTKICHHYPWWRLGDLAEAGPKFQLVTSNANLQEFSEAALVDYLALFSKCLAPDGAFVVQCTGHKAHGDISSLLDRLYNARFALLMFVEEKVPANLPRKSTPVRRLMGRFSGSDGETSGKLFTTNNMLLVKEGHPLFERYYNRENFRPQFIAEEEIVARTFFSSSTPGRQRYTSEMLLTKLQ